MTQDISPRTNLATKLASVKKLITGRKNQLESELEELSAAEDVVGELHENFEALLDQIDGSLDRVREEISGLKKFIRDRRKDLGYAETGADNMSES